MKFILSEPIFKTIQGEGILTGVPSIFIRFSGCNLRCSWVDASGHKEICDTPYASYSPEAIEISEKEIFNSISSMQLRHIVITGGEPTLRADFIQKITEMFPSYHITVETNGTLPIQNKNVNLWSISPKIKVNNDIDIEKYINFIEKFIKLNPKAKFQIKYVVDGNARDASYLLAIKNRFMGEADIVLMPMGTTVETIDRNLVHCFELSLKHALRVTDRLHIRMFGNEKGT